jgi:NhaA family Na+:H+ antiporter
VAGALGGVLLPALLYALVNGDGIGARGWGIPMATDIAFALAIVRLLGNRVSYGLSMFLAALAIVDDLVAVLVIAVFYTVSVDVHALALAAVILGALIALNGVGVHALGPYLALGVMLWLAVFASGVHATVAGVLLAMTIPVETPLDAGRFSAHARALLDSFERGETGDGLVLTSSTQQESLHALHVVSTRVNPALLRLEHALHRPVAFAVLPAFALANAGVPLSGLGDTLASPIAVGVVLGLSVGKPVGITLAGWLAVRLGLAALPAQVTWLGLHGASWLAGIGFTMALFIATLSFGDSQMLETAKAGILAGSVVSGVVGWTLLRRTAVLGTPASTP